MSVPSPDEKVKHERTGRESIGCCIHDFLDTETHFLDAFAVVQLRRAPNETLSSNLVSTIVRTPIYDVDAHSAVIIRGVVTDQCMRLLKESAFLMSL